MSRVAVSNRGSVGKRRAKGKSGWVQDWNCIGRIGHLDCDNAIKVLDGNRLHRHSYLARTECCST